MIRKTSAMVEAGILAAIAIVLLLSACMCRSSAALSIFMAPAYRYLRYAQRIALERYDADSS